MRWRRRRNVQKPPTSNCPRRRLKQHWMECINISMVYGAGSDTWIIGRGCAQRGFPWNERPATGEFYTSCLKTRWVTAVLCYSMKGNYIPRKVGDSLSALNGSLLKPVSRCRGGPWIIRNGRSCPESVLIIENFLKRNLKFVLMSN